jgi:hypothetical protein
MIMSPGLQRLALTAHITSSVGWLGAVVGFLALAIVGVTSQDAHTVRAVYLVMEPVGWFVLVPLSLASLLTGLVQSLGTKWGLLQHYWILAKLCINVFANLVLLMYMQTLGYLADVAADTTSPDAIPGVLRNTTAVLHAGGALLLLLVAVTLSVYKPRGMTRYGQRKQHERRGSLT